MKKYVKGIIISTLVITVLLLTSIRVNAITFDGIVDDSPEEKSVNVDYTITLDYNDGSGRTNTVKMGKYVKINNLPTITRVGFDSQGYIFKGWWTSPTDGKQLKNGDTFNYNKNMTLYAHWEGKEFKVILHPNGGEVTPGEITVKYDGKYSNIPTPTREGYTFLGWFTNKGGIVFDAEYYSSKYADLKKAFGTNEAKLKNHWLKNGMKEGRQCSVFNVNNGLKFKNTIFADGASESTYIIVGKSFGVNLYAKWEVNKYTITLDANGGSVSSNKITVTYGDKIGDLPTPKRTDHSFLGWYTDKEKGEKVTKNNVYKTEGNTTLYAHWKYEERYIITYSYYTDKDGWSKEYKNGATAGVPGSGQEIRSLKINLVRAPYGGNHMDMVYTPESSSGHYDTNTRSYMTNAYNKGQKVRAIQIDLTKDVRDYFDVKYRVYQDGKWSSWGKNNTMIGNKKSSHGIEAIEIDLEEINFENKGREVLMRCKETGKTKVIKVGTPYMFNDDILGPLTDGTGYISRVISTSESGLFDVYSTRENYLQSPWKKFRLMRLPNNSISTMKVELTNGGVYTFETVVPKYLDRKWDGNKIVEESKYVENPKYLFYHLWKEVYDGTETFVLDSGWWVFDRSITIPSTIEIKGDVKIILLDGQTLTINKKGIVVPENSSLTIYSEGKDTGKIIVKSNDNYMCAGIGGCSGMIAGSITINGGDITSTGGYESAGIGSSHGIYSAFKNITINGGRVVGYGGGTKTSGLYTGGNGIGGGCQSKIFGNITINGGKVYAKGGVNAAGIGRFSSITVRDNLQVKAGESGQALEVCANNNLDNCLQRRKYDYASVEPINKSKSGTAFGKGSIIIVILAGIGLIGFTIYSVVYKNKRVEETKRLEKHTKENNHKDNDLTKKTNNQNNNQNKNSIKTNKNVVKKKKVQKK